MLKYKLCLVDLNTYGYIAGSGRIHNGRFWQKLFNVKIRKIEKGL